MGEIVCPHCHQPIYDEDALLCHFCGNSLERAGDGFLSKIKYGNNRIVWFFVIFVVILAFILLFIR